MFSALLLFSSTLFFNLFIKLTTMNTTLICTWEIISLNSTPMEITLLLDPISLSFASVVCLISSNIMLFSLDYMHNDKAYKRFFWLLLFFVISMNLLILVPNLISLLAGWDGLGLTSFCLVIYYQSKKSLSAGMITVLMNRIGDSMLLMTIGLMMTQGHWNINDTQVPHSFMIFIALFVIIAAMTKSAQAPFSSWLPAAMAAPTPVSALVHSSTLVTAGVYLLIRFYPSIYNLNLPIFFNTLLFVAIITTLMAGISATLENDLKKIIALSTLSQLGVMVTATGLGFPLLALFHLYTHALFKATLFLAAGSIIHSSKGYQDIRMLSNMWKSTPFSMVTLNICSLSLCGIPFLAGFYSKDMILESMISSSNLLMMITAMVATLFTIIYSFRLLIASTWSLNKPLPWKLQTTEEAPLTIFPILTLTSGAILGGSLFYTLLLNTDTAAPLPELFKFMVPALIITGIMMAFMSWHPLRPPKYPNSSPLKHLLSTMWFLTWLSSSPTMKANSLKGKHMTKTLDFGWMEVFGGQGMFLMNKQTTKQNQLWQMQLITVLGLLMMAFFLFFLTTLLLYS
uniref:NADH-ubiquinone oxidoreductase chain 5 n=1 Tax=Laevipilina antarctica TaxID=358449 RepID=A0A1L6BZZ0_9MOLL|nr:NADH dehydrogenase subunit 5 [Laevipilina antarctica]APQ42963.1 NADH dehydrogenase subunit 5 [Laevipilina antarctica]